MKERTKGFISGILVTALVIALSVGIFAAAQTITVNGGIKIQIDGQSFTPTDANGNPVDVFESNGTTYLPVRAIAGVAGYDVSWDGATRTVKLTSGSSASPVGNPAPAQTAGAGGSQSTKTFSRDNWPAGKVLGSVDSDKYHNSNCRGAQRILPENEIWFDSVQAAQSAGYTPCGYCY